MLKEHIKLHAILKPYECHICDMKFARTASLKIHLYSHSNNENNKLVNKSKVISQKEKINKEEKKEDKEQKNPIIQKCIVESSHLSEEKDKICVNSPNLTSATNNTDQPILYQNNLTNQSQANNPLNLNNTPVIQLINYLQLILSQPANTNTALNILNLSNLLKIPVEALTSLGRLESLSNNINYLVNYFNNAKSINLIDCLKGQTFHN